MKSLLIKDTTREERIRIVAQGLSQCGGACDFCNGCDNIGGGSVDAYYEPYINGKGVNIKIPVTVTSIVDDAFAGSNVIVIGKAGGYVEQYCEEKGFTFAAGDE